MVSLCGDMMTASGVMGALRLHSMVSLCGDMMTASGVMGALRLHSMVSLCGDMAHSRGLDLMGWRLPYWGEVATEVVRCESNSHSDILRIGFLHFNRVVLHYLSMCMSRAHSFKSNLHLLTNRSAADENYQALNSSNSSSVPCFLPDLEFHFISFLQTMPC
jgi:hypothetical protein